MRKVKTYYTNKNGDMAHSARAGGPWTEVEANTFYAKLKLVKVVYQNSGLIFILQDENKKEYIMNTAMFIEYLEKNDIYFEGDWNFYKSGAYYSIGL